MKKLHMILALFVCTACSATADDTPQNSTHTITVLGGVKQPGMYTIQSAAPRLVDAIASAGGLSQRASSKDVVVKRSNQGRVDVIRVDLGSILSGSAPFHSIRSGDLVFVREHGL